MWKTRSETSRAAASMRPQHITAENLRQQPRVAIGRHASMRPQHITAENIDTDDDGAWVQVASMRPQHITAENPGRTITIASEGSALQ